MFFQTLALENDLFLQDLKNICLVMEDTSLDGYSIELRCLETKYLIH